MEAEAAGGKQHQYGDERRGGKSQQGGGARSIAEIEQALKMIPAKTKLLPVEGGGHDLGFKGKAKREELPGVIFSEFMKLTGVSS